MSRPEDNEDSIEKKGFWSMGLLPTKAPHLIFADGRLQRRELTFSLAAKSIIEELLVNVLDQQVRAAVSRLRVNFYVRDGIVEIINDGPGFNVVQDAFLYNEVGGVRTPLWKPFVQSMFLFQGDQANPPPNSVTGGVNGVGLKTTTRSCKWFELITVDAATGLCYALHVTHRGREWVKNRSGEMVRDGGKYRVADLPFEAIKERCGEIDLAPRMTIGGVPTKIEASQPFTSMRMAPRFTDKFEMKDEATVRALGFAIEGRLYEMAVLLDAPIVFNDSVIGISGTGEERLAAFIKLIHGAETKPKICTMDPEGWGADVTALPLERRWTAFRNPTKHHFPLRVAVVMDKTADASNNWAIINGVVIRTAECKLFLHVRKQIEAAVSKRLNIGSCRALVTNYSTLYVAGFVPQPQWESQSKNGGNFSVEPGFYTPYVLPEKFVMAVADEIVTMIKQMQNENLVAESIKVLQQTAKLPILNEYTPCPKSQLSFSWAIRSQTHWFVSEGSSAYKTLNKGLFSASCPLNRDYIGHYAMRGVPTNARQNTVELKKPDGRVVLLPTPHLASNVVWAGFVHVMGLDYHKSYESDAEFRTLKAGKIWIATDQDVDGEGKITSLILNYIDVFWPALLKRQWVGRLVTDLVRVMKGPKLVATFQSEEQFREWASNKGYFALLTDDVYDYARRQIAANPMLEGRLRERVLSTNPSADALQQEILILQIVKERIMRGWSEGKKLEVEYFKGLGGHTQQFIEHMMNKANLPKNLVTFTYDERSAAYFAAYFDNDTAPRKDLLRAAFDGGKTETAPHIVDGKLSCTDHLRVAYKLFCWSDHERKLSNVISGMNNVKTRVLYGILQYFTGRERLKKVKVDTLFAALAKMTDYHHGSQILIDVIAGCAKTFYGSKRFPFFIAFGEFGSRYNPDPAAPRYTVVAANFDVVEVLYPVDDLAVLPYCFEDGKRTIPQYFCPIIPPLFEMTEMPSHGWRFCAHAIDVRVLLKMTRALVGCRSSAEADAVARTFPMKLDVNGWHGRLVEVAGVTLSFGCARWTGDCCEIWELPIGVTGQEWEARFKKLGMKPIVDSDKMTWGDHPYIAKPFNADSIFNHSNGKVGAKGEISIKFRCDVSKMAALKIAKFKDVELDEDLAVLYNLGLWSMIEHHLNYVGIDGRVLELPDYYAVIGHWLPERRRLYIERLRRELCLAVMELAYVRSLDRFFAWPERLHLQKAGITEEVADQMFVEGGFFKFAHGVLGRPDYLSAKSLPLLVTGFYSLETFEAAFAAGNAAAQVAVLGEAATIVGGMVDGGSEENTRISYEYLHGTHFRSGYAKQTAARAEKIAKLEARVAWLRGPNAWRETWIAELDKFQAICATNLPNMWTKRQEVALE